MKPKTCIVCSTGRLKAITIEATDYLCAAKSFKGFTEENTRPAIEWAINKLKVIATPEEIDAMIYHIISGKMT